MSRKYQVLLPDGVTRGVDVDEFRKATTKYLTERLDGLVIVKMRCYKDGRWDITIRSMWFPNTVGYNKKYRTSWLRPDIREIMDDIIADYYDWVIATDKSVDRLIQRMEASNED